MTTGHCDDLRDPDRDSRGTGDHLARPSHLRIHYRIQHAAGRDEPLERLLRQIGSAEIITDFGDPPNPWRGYQACLESPPATHLCILQDDVILCEDFRVRVLEYVEERPDNVISLWVGALRGETMRRYHQAMIRKERWSEIFFQGIHHCVGVVWPQALAVDFLEWAQTTKIPGLPEDNRSDDAVFGAWAKLTHQRVFATIPSLVEHDDSFPSTIGRPSGDRGRRAIHFSG